MSRSFKSKGEQGYEFAQETIQYIGRLVEVADEKPSVTEGFAKIW
jgi:hypothetical protein